jgi:iduronate 2-sulfatase
MPEAKPQISARLVLFNRKDSDHDGFLTRDEFLANQPDPAEAPKRFERFDTNQDGRLSKQEFLDQGKR